MAESATKPAAAAEKTAVPKPERPDEEAFKKELALREKELKAANDRMTKLKGQIETARPNNKESPTEKRRAELRAEQQQIRQQQQSSKTSRGPILDKIKRLDEQLKSRITESKSARGKVQYKSAEDVQTEIDRLRAQVDTGKMQLVEERKALDTISQLNRIKKSFSSFDEAQKGIDDTKAQIAELRKQLDDPQSKALSDRYAEIGAELDKIKAEQDEAFKNINALRDERTKAHEDQQKKYAAVKEIKDAYFQQRRAARDYEQEARRIREEKRRAENDAYHRGRRQEAAKAKLEDASAPAYEEEIRTARSVLAQFDPSSVAKQEASGPGKFAAEASRKIEAGGIKGTALKKKSDEDDDNYFVGGAGKKKKGRKGPAASGEKFQLDLGTINRFARIGVDPPMSQADVPAVVEKIKEKLDFWTSDQDRKTKENMAAAQAEIDKLEAEAEATSNGVKEIKPHVNGSASAGAEKNATAEKDQDPAVADATESVENIKLES